MCQKFEQLKCQKTSVVQMRDFSSISNVNYLRLVMASVYFDHETNTINVCLTKLTHFYIPEVT